RRHPGWDIATRSELLHIPPQQGVGDAWFYGNHSLSVDGARLAMICSNLRTRKSGELTVWDTEKGRTILSFSVAGIFGEPAFSRDGTRIAAVVLEGTSDARHLCVWGADTGKEHLRIELPSYNALDSVVFSPDGKRLASCVLGSGSANIHIWNAADG